MFSLLRLAHNGDMVMMDLFSASPTQSLASVASTDDFASHSMSIAVSPELLEKEKEKAKQGYCETALWNCNDLWGP